MLRFDFIRYAQKNPAGPLIYIMTERQENQEIKCHGPHSVGDVIYIIGTDVFGTIVNSEYQDYCGDFLKVIWEDGIVSVDFRPDAVLRNMIRVDNDSPQERLKIKLKYADYT